MLWWVTKHEERFRAVVALAGAVALALVNAPNDVATVLDVLDRRWLDGGG